MRSVLKTCGQLQKWYQANRVQIMSFDTETTSLDYLKLDINGCSLSNGVNSCYIDLADNPEAERLIVCISAVVNSIDLLIMHNAPFDLKVLHKIGLGHIEPNVFCTMTAAHLLNENVAKDLKFLATFLLHKQDVIDYKTAQSFGIHSQRFYDYATDDAEWTYELYKIFKPKLTAQNLDNLFYNIEMPFQYCLRDLEINGIKVDLGKLEQLAITLKKSIEDSTIKLCGIANIPYWYQKDLFGADELICNTNFGSSTQLVEILTKRFKLKITEKTAKGKPSVGKATKKKLSNHPFVAELIRYSKFTSLYNGFVKKMTSRIDIDGRLRINFNNCIAVTGRLSTSNPNLQNTPRKNEELGYDFRTIFVADKGKVLVGGDFGGQELRVLGDLCKDPKMLEAFRKNKDLHLMSANGVFGLDIPDEQFFENHIQYKETKAKHSEKRNQAKNSVVFPLIYGSTAAGIAKSLNVNLTVAQSYIDGFLNTFPGVRQAINKCHRFLRQYLYVYNRTGRRRRFDKVTDKAKRQAFNFLIQGTSADMTKAAMVAVRILGLNNPNWDMKLILTVHDEIIVEVLQQYADECLQKMEIAMAQAYPLIIPIIVEMGKGCNYSELK